jgi:hypothetical protein
LIRVMTHLRQHDLLVHAGFLALALAAAGCGSPGGGGGSSDAAVGLGSGGKLGSGSGGSFGSGGQPGSGTDACNLPRCFLDVISACIPQGTCKTQSMSTSSTTCWSNGVKQVASVDFNSMSSTVKYTKPDGSTCWYYEMPYTGAGVPDKITVSYKDGSGRVFSTLTYDGTTGQVAVACPGGQPQPLNALCLATMMSGSGMAADPEECPAGTCPVVGQFGDGR